jgi:hypothetical protein
MLAFGLLGSIENRNQPCHASIRSGGHRKVKYQDTLGGIKHGQNFSGLTAESEEDFADMILRVIRKTTGSVIYQPAEVRLMQTSSTKIHSATSSCDDPSNSGSDFLPLRAGQTPILVANLRVCDVGLPLVSPSSHPPPW